jgi:hypothetical protein
MRRALLGDDHTDVAIAARDLAELLAEQGKAADAEPLAREALEIERRAWPPAHPEVATAQSVLGACLAAARRFEEAEPLLRASHQVLHTRFGPQSPWTRAAAERLTLLRQAPPRPPTPPAPPRSRCGARSARWGPRRRAMVAAGPHAVVAPLERRHRAPAACLTVSREGTPLTAVSAMSVTSSNTRRPLG